MRSNWSHQHLFSQRSKKGNYYPSFLDADKGGSPDDLNKLLPLVHPGGLILADNVDMSAAFRKAVTTNPALEMLFWGNGGDLGVR